MSRLRAPQRRDQLIRTAASVFAKHGYDGATTAAIAAAAGISEPVLYRHFNSKQEMFEAIVRELLQKLTARWQVLSAAGEDPVEQVRIAMRKYAEAVAAVPDFYRVLIGAILTCQDPAVLSLIREYYSTSEQQIATVLRMGQQRQVFRTDMDAEDLAWVLIDMAIGYAVQETKLLPGRTTAEFFIKAVLAAVGAR